MSVAQQAIRARRKAQHDPRYAGKARMSVEKRARIEARKVMKIKAMAARRARAKAA